MSIIPLHLQRRCEQRWAARFGSLVFPAVPKKNAGLKVSPATGPARGKSQRKPRRVEAEGEGKWSTIRKAPIQVFLPLSEKL
jgi:hypothetical protein